MSDSGDSIAQAFRPVLPLMLSAIAGKGGHTPEVVHPSSPNHDSACRYRTRVNGTHIADMHCLSEKAIH